MKHPKPGLASIGLILLGAFLIPALVVILRELSSLRQDEAVLKEVYANQLEAVLFSVNTYSQDLADGWAGKLDRNILSPDKQKDSLFNQFMLETGSVRWMFVMDEKELNIYGNYPDKKEVLEEKIKDFEESQRDTLDRLASYMENGFRKLEAFSESSIDSLPLLLFLLPRPNDLPILCGLFIDPKKYIQSVLAPKMQEAARQKVIVFIYFQEKDEIIYSTEPFSQTQIPQYKPLWLMPGYQVGILLKGPSLEALAERRSYSNLLLIIFMNLIILIGIIWVFRNIRKEVRLAQKKSDFVSNVSHEIRTPLSLISMFAETLAMGRVRTEEKKKEYYDIIGQESARLARTVNKILNFSKMEAGKRTYQMESVDLIALITEILHSYDYHLRQQGFTYRFEKTADQLMVQADKEAIAEAFINLIDNAINYSENEKEMLITCEQQGEQIILSVTDQGIGIPESEQKAIFDKFYRVSSATVHNTKGTGLGLSLVKHIMLAHGGDVLVSSKAGKGSTFRLVFREGL